VLRSVRMPSMWVKYVLRCRERDSNPHALRAADFESDETGYKH
jgi:hypothetical protein